MKLKDLGTFQKNSRNGQNTLHIRAKKLKKLGMTPEELSEMTLLKPKSILPKRNLNVIKKEVSILNGK